MKGSYPTGKFHGSMGDMVKGVGNTGKFGQIKPGDVGVGGDISTPSAPNTPGSPASGKPHCYEGGKGGPVNVPKEKNYSYNGPTGS